MHQRSLVTGMELALVSRQFDNLTWLKESKPNANNFSYASFVSMLRF